ncbi:MAG: hypothetical protein AAFS10_01350, partial [Myxococcota bacterium]
MSQTETQPKAATSIRHLVLGLILVVVVAQAISLWTLRSAASPHILLKPRVVLGLHPPWDAQEKVKQK